MMVGAVHEYHPVSGTAEMLPEGQAAEARTEDNGMWFRVLRHALLLIHFDRNAIR